jgi:hypothetical protein
MAEEPCGKGEIDLSKVNGLFIVALTDALRERGLKIGLPETLTCTSLLTIQSKWSRAELTAVLSTVLVRQAGELTLLCEVLDDLLDQEAPQATKEPESYLPGRLPPPELDDNASNVIRQAGEHISNVIRQAGEYISKTSERMRSFKLAHATADLRLWIILILILVALAVRFAPESELPDYYRVGVSETSMYRAIPWSLGLVFLSLGAWRAFMKRRGSGVSNSAQQQLPASRARKKPLVDNTIFRIGSVGGEPPSFLTSTIAQEIAATCSRACVRPMSFLAGPVED